MQQVDLRGVGIQDSETFVNQLSAQGLRIVPIVPMGWDDGAEWIAAYPQSASALQCDADCIDAINAENDGMGVSSTHPDAGYQPSATAAYEQAVDNVTKTKGGLWL